MKPLSPPTFLICALLLGALAAGCQPGDDLPPPPDAWPPDNTDQAAVVTCTNDEIQATVRYPRDWHTNTGEVMPACSLFDPEPIEVDPATDIPLDIAVIMRLEQRPFEAFGEPVRGEQRDASGEVTVDGRRGLAVDWTTTGEGMLPEGVRVRSYYVEHGQATLVAETYELGDPSFTVRQAILDRVMETLVFEN
jgi:hypothetical protein